MILRGVMPPTPAPHLGPGHWRLRGQARLGRFMTHEEGMMAPFILVLFFFMVVIGGISVDIMRYETQRVATQNTLDRATLAAASMTQKLDPTSVVNDYFAKANLSSDLENIAVSMGTNYRIVEAQAAVSSKNYFMSILDIPNLQGHPLSEAEQRIPNVEIALVLDVSGSMYNTPSRIRNLKSAAKEFVSTVLDDNTENKISISLVPYNGQVNLGPQLMARYNVTHRQNYAGTDFATSYCVDLPSNSYGTTLISPNTTLPQTPFVDSFSDNSDSAPTYDRTRGLYSNVWCPPVAGNYVRVHSNNATQLRNQIDALVAIGATSIDLGMKWGTTLLDPGSRSVVASLASAGQVPNAFRDRPADYSDEETMKVIVLMTDGENFVMERMEDAYRVGPSPIYRRNSGNREYSVFHEGQVNKRNATQICNSRPYWVPHLSAWHSRPWNGAAPGNSACYVENANTSGTTRQDWGDVWTQLRVKYVAWQFYARALGTDSTRNSLYNTWVENFRSQTSTTSMDSRLKTICDAAKARGILVYGIAFETNATGRAAIRSCVTDPQRTYYDVAGLSIADAFASIAANISQLRLTR